MSEEIFRQERRPVTSQDIKGETPASKLARAQEIQKEIGRGETPEEPVIKGNIPPRLQEALEKHRAATKIEQKTEGGTIQNPVFNYSTPNPELDALFSQLREKTGRFEEITLPSLGKFYNGSDGPSDGKLHIRPMTGNEEMILGTPRFLKKGIAMDMIFKECIKEPIQPAKLLTVDRTFILIYLRGISHGHEYEVEVRCPECSSSFNHTVDLNLPVELCPEEFGNASLEEKLPGSGFRFRYRLSTGADEQAVNEHQERRLKTFGDTAMDDTILYRMALLTENIEQVKGTKMIQAVLQRLPIEDINYLRNLIIDPPFGPKTKIDIFCPSCNHDFQVNLPIEIDFFFPRRKKEDKKAQV